MCDHGRGLDKDGRARQACGRHRRQAVQARLGRRASRRPKSSQYFGSYYEMPKSDQLSALLWIAVIVMFVDPHYTVLFFICITAHE